MARGFLVRLLCLLVVPVVVFSTPTTARAATTYGPGADASFTFAPDQVNTAEAFCEVSAYWVLTETIQTVKGSLKCSTNWAISSLVASEWTFSGPGCSLVGGSATELDGTNTILALMTEGLVAPCPVNSVCFDFTYFAHGMAFWQDHITESVCAPIAVGAPEAAAGGGNGSCASGAIEVERPTIARPLWYGTYDGYSTRYTWQQQYRFRIKDTTVGAHWRRYIITRGPTGELISGPLAGSLTGDINLGSALGNDITAAGVWSEPLTTQRMASWRGGSAAPGPANQTVIGIGYFRGGKGLAWGDYSALPQAKATGILGVTDPARCAFYWGEKIADLPANTFDEPLGGLDAGSGAPPGSDTEPVLDPEPPSDGDTCDFQPTSPSTWFCALSGLIGALIDAVRAIPGLILDGLEAFFMPHPETWGVEAFVEDVKGRPPFSIITGMGDVATATASGWSSASDCAGNLLRLPIQDAPAANVSCNAVRNAEGMSGLYLLAQLAIWGCAGWGIWNMVQTSIQRSAS